MEPKPEQTKMCASCRQYKPESQLVYAMVKRYDGGRHGVLRCKACWEKRGR